MLYITAPILHLPTPSPGAGRETSPANSQRLSSGGRTEQSALWELLMRPA